MGRETGRLDYWRRFFGSCDSDILEVINNAILVASLDCPRELLRSRDSIAERLFSFRAGDLEREEGIGGGEGGGGGGGDKADAINGDGGQAVASYDEVEALTEELEEEGQAVGEVLRIKELLSNNEFKSDSDVFESLRRLQFMDISVETLKSTEIGKIINGLRKHNSKPIRQLARILIDGWKAMVEEWANSTAVLAEATPESANPPPSSDQWEGLALPPIDEGALLATQTGAMELSQFFDGMDDDGNIRSNDTGTDIDNRTMKQRKSAPRAPQDRHPARKPEAMNVPRGEPNFQNKQDKTKHRGVTNVVANQHKQSNGRSHGSGSETLRYPLPCNDQKAAQDVGPSKPSTEVRRKPPAEKACAEDSVREKLEMSKRKLHEGYRQAETAKRQRTIQVMELHDLPKQSLGNRQLHQKQTNSRYWANNRRV